MHASSINRLFVFANQDRKLLTSVMSLLDGGSIHPSAIFAIEQYLAFVNTCAIHHQPFFAHPGKARYGRTVPEHIAGFVIESEALPEAEELTDFGFRGFHFGRSEELP